jgi:hypothetical protein
MANTIKAVRAEIRLGDIPLNVYMLPDGRYKLSGRNVTDAIDEASNSVLRIMRVKSLKDLPHAGLERYKLTAGKEGSPFDPLSIEDAATYWGEMSQRGNKKATAILVACAIEAIERRADAVFKIQRTEEERNERLKERIQGKLIRRTFTDAIQDYQGRHPELSDTAKKFLYINASDAVNRAVFGRQSYKLFADLGIPKNALLRDYLNPIELRHIQQVEDLAIRLIDSLDMPPKAAVDEAKDRLMIKISTRVLNKV